MDESPSAPRISPGSRHPIPVREPGLPFDASIPRHWMAGNALATHFINGLNLTFPDGERFFIRAVSEHADRIRDPGLRDQVRGFFGQEASHAREHERYFQTLRDQGYEIDGFVARFQGFLRWTYRWLPRGVRLGMTSGAEHWTATFGALALDHPLVLERSHPTMRALILWHATEEIEHKAVAFDVFEASYGRGPGAYLLRMLGFLFATALITTWTTIGTRMLLDQDGLTRDQRRRARRALWTPELSAAARELLAGALRYARPGFHPNHSDELDHAHARLAEFGVAARAEV